MKKATILLALLLFAVLQGAFAQRTITGKVIDGENRLGMPGVSVVVKGTTTGMATDAAGNFSLIVPNNRAIIVVSFMGFKTVEVPVGSNTQFTFTLHPDARVLGEVVVTARRNNQHERVVTAMGIERDMRTIPYAVSVIPGDEIRKSADFYFMRTLVGRVPSLEVIVVDGIMYPFLRNVSSFSQGNIPALYVLDGMPISVETASALNRYDIENITVLRGANAAMLYGSAAAGGAIVITTTNPSTVLQRASAQQGASSQRTIIGNVISGENEVGVSGVAVVVKGTSTIAVTDSDGNFVLKVPNDAVMIVMCMGFRTVEIPVENKTWYEIMLQPEINVLDNNDVP